MHETVKCVSLLSGCTGTTSAYPHTELGVMESTDVPADMPATGVWAGPVAQLGSFVGWDSVPHGCLRSSRSKRGAGACDRAPSPAMAQLLGDRIRLLFACFQLCAFGIPHSLSCLGLLRVSG